MLRPLSMPGGSLHWPLWQPYELYGTVDYIYGWKAFNEKNGFTAAQGFLNIVESALYGYYLYILYAYGRQSKAQGRGAPKMEKVGWLGEQRYVDGEMGAVAVVVAYSAAVMTVSKTVLYCKIWHAAIVGWKEMLTEVGMNEYYSGFENIGHNKAIDLILLWIIPKSVLSSADVWYGPHLTRYSGAWLVLPSYMIYLTGAEILQGLTIAAGGAVPSSDDTAVVKTE